MKEGGPWFVLVAGINGAGKSTFAQNHGTLRVLLEARGPEIEVINPDLITREILRSEPKLPLKKANIRAANECERRVRDLVKGNSVTHPTADLVRLRPRIPPGVTEFFCVGVGGLCPSEPERYPLAAPAAILLVATICALFEMKPRCSKHR